MVDRTPVEELEGRKLDVAVREKVRERPGWAVDPTGVEAEQVMYFSEMDPNAGLRSAWSREVVDEYDENQKTRVAPHYSSDEEEALDLHRFILNDHPSPAVRERYQDLSPYAEAGGTPPRGHDDDEEMDVDPEAVCRTALRAVRGST